MLFQRNRASANRLTLLGGFASVMLWWCRESWTIAAVAHHQQTPVLVAVIGRRVVPPPWKMSHIRPQVGLISGRWGDSDMLWVSKTWFISWLWVCYAGVLCDGAEMQVKPSCLRGAGKSVLPITASSAVGAEGTSRALGVTSGCGGDVEEHWQGQGTLWLSELFGSTQDHVFSPRTVSFREYRSRCVLQ